MKRLTAAILVAVLWLAASPAGVAASPNCGTRTELQVFAGGSQTGELLGVMCGDERSNTYSYDANMGDLSAEFRSGDDNDAASFKFYNPTGGTWCLVFWNQRDGAQKGGERLVYDHLGPTSSWWGPAGGLMTGLINEASSVQIYHKRTYEAGDCNGVFHQTIF
jgi:hypothetical protein